MSSQESSTAAARTQIKQFFQRWKTKAVDPRKKTLIWNTYVSPISRVSENPASSSSSYASSSSVLSPLLPSVCKEIQTREKIETSHQNKKQEVNFKLLAKEKQKRKLRLRTNDFCIFDDRLEEEEHDPRTPKTPEYSPVTPASPDLFFYSPSPSQSPSSLPPVSSPSSPLQTQSRNPKKPRTSLKTNLQDTSCPKTSQPQKKRKKEQKHNNKQNKHKETTASASRDKNKILESKSKKINPKKELQSRPKVKDAWIVRGSLRTSLENLARPPAWHFTVAIKEKMLQYVDRFPNGEFRSPLCWSSTLECSLEDEHKILQCFTNFLRWNLSVEPVDNILRKIENEWGKIGHVLRPFGNRIVGEGDYIVWYREDRQNVKTFDRKGLVRKPQEGLSLYPVCFRGVGKILAIVQPQNKDPADPLFIVQPILYCFSKEYQRDLKKRQKDQKNFIKIVESLPSNDLSQLSSSSFSSSSLVAGTFSSPSSLILPSFSIPIPPVPVPLPPVPPFIFTSPLLPPSIPRFFPSGHLVSQLSPSTAPVPTAPSTNWLKKIQNPLQEKEKESQKETQKQLFYVVLSSHKCLRLYCKDEPLLAWKGTFPKETSYCNLSLQNSEQWNTEELTFARLFFEEKLLEIERSFFNKKAKTENGIV